MLENRDPTNGVSLRAYGMHNRKSPIIFVKPYFSLYFNVIDVVYSLSKILFNTIRLSNLEISDGVNGLSAIFE